MSRDRDAVKAMLVDALQGATGASNAVTVRLVRENTRGIIEHRDNLTYFDADKLAETVLQWFEARPIYVVNNRNEWTADSVHTTRETAQVAADTMNAPYGRECWVVDETTLADWPNSPAARDGRDGDE